MASLPTARSGRSRGPTGARSRTWYTAATGSGRSLVVGAIGMALDHPFGHPDDPAGPVWSRPDRRGIRREQARSVWSRPNRRRAPGYGSGGWGFESLAARQTPQVSDLGLFALLAASSLPPRVGDQGASWPIKEARQPLMGRRLRRARAAHRTEAPGDGPRTCRPGWRCTVRVPVRRPAGRGPGPPFP